MVCWGGGEESPDLAREGHINLAQEGQDLSDQGKFLSPRLDVNLVKTRSTDAIRGLHHVTCALSSLGAFAMLAV